MAELTIPPAGRFAPTTLPPTVIPGTEVPAGEEWSIDLRVTNVTSVEALYRLVLGPTSDVAAGTPRGFDFKIPANESRDIEVKLTVPAGYRLFDRASAANALAVSVTGRKRVTT